MSLLKKLEERITLEVRWLAAFDHTGSEDVLQLHVIVLNQICNASAQLIRATEALQLPVLKVMITALLEDLRRVLLPVTPDRQFFAESVRIIVGLELFSVIGYWLFSRADNQASIVEPEGCISHRLVLQKVLVVPSLRLHRHISGRTHDHIVFARGKKQWDNKDLIAHLI